MPSLNDNVTTVECLICAEPCEALAAFGCGHCVCYLCGLRVHSTPQSNCPVCRKASNSVVVTRAQPEEFLDGTEAIQFSTEAIRTMEAAGLYNSNLKCYVVGEALAKEMEKLCGFLCPLPDCWSCGEQVPFHNLEYLKKHLLVDHKLTYCKVCLAERKVFLCEQHVYSREEMSKHMVGNCAKDSTAFTGHPKCGFCTGRYLYDEEQLISHMQHDHFTCDFCPRRDNSFTYYQSRNTLLEHYARDHKICEHPDCAAKDPMERAFASEIELVAHRQRVHGAKSRVSLTLNESAFAPSPAAAAAAATAANTSAFYVICDFLTRRETLELTPSGARPAGEKPRKGGGRRGKAAAAAIGLPAHFRDAECPLSPLTRIAAEGAHDEEAQKGGKGKGKKEQRGHARAFGVTESAEEYNKKNHVPTNQEELRSALDEALKTHLSDLKRRDALRTCTADFMRGDMLATRYYDYLRSECFLTENAFNAVFPLLVATVPLPERRDALVEVDKMRCSPEFQRAFQQRKEEARKQAENAKWMSQRDYAQQLATAQQSKKKNNAKKWNAKSGGQNVWLEKGGASLATKLGAERKSEPRPEEGNASGSVGSASNAVTGSSRLQNEGRRGNNTNSSHWGGINAGSGGVGQTNALSTAPHDSLFTNGNYADPENFPALPSTNTRRYPAQQRQKNQRSNAWFNR